MIASLLLASTMMAATQAPSTNAILFREEVKTTSTHVFLSDVADIKALPLPFQKMAAQVEVARFKDGTRWQYIPIGEIARRIRLRAPAMGYWLPHSGSPKFVHVELALQNIALDKKAAEPICLQAQHALAVGDTALSSDFVEVTCPTGLRPVRTFRIDPDGGVRTVRGLGAQEVTSRFMDFGQDVLSAGQKLHMVAVVGTASVSRDVALLQAVRPGRKAFVRTSDGVVFPLLYAGHSQ